MAPSIDLVVHLATPDLPTPGGFHGGKMDEFPTGSKPKRVLARFGLQTLETFHTKKFRSAKKKMEGVQKTSPCFRLIWG